jgi:tetratricopeptide (TPR) repeat protein
MPSPKAALLLAAALLALPLGAQGMGGMADAQKAYAAGRFDDARRACLDELRADPQNVDAYVFLAWSLIGLERYADAENYALKGYEIRRDPRLTESLGEAAYQLGRNEAALRNLQNYVMAVPEGGRVGVAYYYMGETYLRLARFAHADIAFTTAVQYSPGNARWWARLGWAREKSGDAVHAVEAYDKALAIDPRLEDALNGKERASARIR